MATKTFELAGVEDMLKKLHVLQQSAQEDIAHQVAAKGASLVYRKMKSNIHRASGSYTVHLANGEKITRHPGDLANALIVTRIPESEHRYSAQYKVSFARNKRTQYIGYIAAFIEYGVSPHQIEVNGRSIAHPGHQAYPFLRPTLLAIESSVKVAMEQELKKRLADVWKKS